MTNARKAPFLHGLAGIAGLACALLASSWLGGIILPFSAAAAPPGFVVHRSAHAVIYAPSADAAREGQEEVRYARTRFRELFGAAPANLVVVLADDPGQFRRLDTESLRLRGAGFLAFVTRAHLDAWAGRPLGRTRAEIRPLAHEACHVYVAALAGPVAAAPAAGGSYGHPTLPDWFDEAAATLCESPAGRAERHRQLRELLGQRIPLRELGRMRHPLSDGKVLERLGIRPSPGHVGVHVVPGTEMRRLLPGTGADMFYAQALSLGEFLAERGGPGALGSLARPLAGGRTLDQALGEARQSAPGLPGSLDELEAEWLRWVERGGR